MLCKSERERITDVLLKLEGDQVRDNIMSQLQAEVVTSRELFVSQA